MQSRGNLLPGWEWLRTCRFQFECYYCRLASFIVFLVCSQFLPTIVGVALTFKTHSMQFIKLQLRIKWKLTEEENRWCEPTIEVPWIINGLHFVVNQNNSQVRLNYYCTCVWDFTIDPLLLFHHLSIPGSIIHYQESESINMTNWIWKMRDKLFKGVFGWAVTGLLARSSILSYVSF